MSYQSTVSADSPLYYWKLENSSGDSIDAVGGVEPMVGGGGVTRASASNAAWTGLGGATCWAFSGATASAITEHNVNLTAYSTITVEFLLNWTTFANNDLQAAELGAPAYFDTNGWVVRPNASGSNAFRSGMGEVSGGNVWNDTFVRPSNATWHHYMFVFTRATPANKSYMDGVLQTLTADTHTAATYGNFGSFPVSLMSRNNTTLMGAGSMGQFAIYAGDKSSVASAHFAALTASGAPVANFTGTPTSGSSPLSVAFTDSSTNTPTSWLWEKNDGTGWVNFSGSPTSQNPTESFT